MKEFGDPDGPGYFLAGKNGEQLAANPKEVYDGAIPSGNSVMAYNLTALACYSREDSRPFAEEAKKQIAWLSSPGQNPPSSHTFFLLALCRWLNPAVFTSCRNGVCAPDFEKEEL